MTTEKLDKKTTSQSLTSGWISHFGPIYRLAIKGF